MREFEFFKKGKFSQCVLDIALYDILLHMNKLIRTALLCRLIGGVLRNA